MRRKSKKHFVDLQASHASLGNQRVFFYSESDDIEHGKGIQLADELSDMILFHNRVYQDVLVVNTVIIRIMEYSVCKVKGNGSEMVHCFLCRLL